MRPLWGSGATYALHLRLIGKLVADFLLVIIELFFARCFRSVTIHAFDRQTVKRIDGQTDRQTDVHTTTSPAYMQRGNKTYCSQSQQFSK